MKRNGELLLLWFPLDHSTCGRQIHRRWDRAQGERSTPCTRGIPPGPHHQSFPVDSPQ